MGNSIFFYSLKRVRLFLLLCFAALFFSCKDKNPVEQYDNTHIKTYKDSQQFGEKTTVRNLQESIRAFYAANGRYPNDLKELEDFTGVLLDSSKYDYDPATGVITQRKQ